MSKPLKVAVVGTNIGCTLHVRALRGAGFEVTALVGQRAERTRARADHFQIPGALTSLEAALDSDIDAIVIASPPATHRPFTLHALAAGKHVLCEKPLALDTGEAREMRDAAKASGLVHQLVHPHRWKSQNALARRLLRRGAIGPVLQANFVFDTSLTADSIDILPEWWLHRDQGGGWLRNYNAHGIDTARYMLGEFAAVSGTVRPDLGRGMSADDAYAMQFVLADGTQGTMRGTCRARDFLASSRLISEQASLLLDWTSIALASASGTQPLAAPEDLLAELLAGGPHPGAPAECLPAPTNLYEIVHTSDDGYSEQVAMARTFRSRILDRSYTHPAVADFDDGVAHMEVIDAVERSHAERRWIDLPLA